MNARDKSSSGFAAPNQHSFDLDEEMLRLLGEEFEPLKLAESLADAIKDKQGKELEKIGEKVFSEYGRNWMKKSMQLGEEYTDRTYEVLKLAIEETGQLFFPLVPQRFIEIAYLSILDFSSLPIVENLRQCLVYRIADCSIFKAVKEKCGEQVGNMLLCRNGCLCALNTLCQELKLGVTPSMEAEMTREGYCQFALRRS